MEKPVDVCIKGIVDCILISIDEEDAANLADPHHNGIVILLTIGICLLRRVLVDNGSSANIIMLDALQSMGLRQSNIIKNSTTMLVGFSGEAKQYTW